MWRERRQERLRLQARKTRRWWRRLSLWRGCLTIARCRTSWIGLQGWKVCMNITPFTVSLGTRSDFCSLRIRLRRRRHLRSRSGQAWRAPHRCRSSWPCACTVRVEQPRAIDGIRTGFPTASTPHILRGRRCDGLDRRNRLWAQGQGWDRLYAASDNRFTRLRSVCLLPLGRLGLRNWCKEDAGQGAYLTLNPRSKSGWWSSWRGMTLDEIIKAFDACCHHSSLLGLFFS